MNIEFNMEDTGHRLRTEDLNVMELARVLYDNKIRWKNGKIIGEHRADDGTRTFVGLHEGQEKVIKSPARFKVVACGRRWGKTGCAALVALATILQPNRRIWVVGPEYSHVEKVFQELYYILVVQLKLVGKSVPNSAARKSKGDYYIETPWGSIIEGKSSGNPDSMAGEALDLVIFDEAGLERNLSTIWRQMLRPTLGDKSGSAMFISTPRGKNDFYKLFKTGELGRRQEEGYVKIANKDEDFRDWASWSMPSYTNPFIPRSEYDDAKKEALMAGTYLLFQQEYDADFESVSDAAFPGFRATKPDPEDPDIRTPYHAQDYKYSPDYGPWFASCDYNIARPASTIYAQVDKQGNVMIFDELFKANTTAYMQAEYIKEKCKELGIGYRDVIGDISGSFATAKGMNEFNQFQTVLGHAPVGIRQGRETGNHLIHEWLSYPIISKDGSVKIDEFGNPETYPKLFVASHCIETIHALETAKKKTSKDGSIKQDYAEFTSGHEGLLDAIRYLLVYLFHERQTVTSSKGLY